MKFLRWFRRLPAPPPHSGPARVLVAGFDVDLGADIEAAAWSQGCPAYYAGAPAAAVRLLRVMRPHVVVLDAACGAALVRATIDAFRRAGVEVIALAADTGTREMCLALGARDVLPRQGAREALGAVLRGGVAPV